MGHCMLMTTPESLGEMLPHEDRESSLVISSDARIDNRTALIALLGSLLKWPESAPDSLLILAAYKKWGKKCVQHLIGDFSFAIWDKKKESPVLR